MTPRKRTTELPPDPEANKAEGSGAAEDAKPDVATYTKVFVVSLKGIVGSTDELTDEAFHNANKVATLQEAINSGFRTTGDVELAGQETEGEGRTSRLLVSYSAPVVPASEDERHPSEVPNPRETIIAMGGSTAGDVGATGA